MSSLMGFLSGGPKKTAAPSAAAKNAQTTDALQKISVRHCLLYRLPTCSARDHGRGLPRPRVQRCTLGCARDPLRRRYTIVLFDGSVLRSLLTKPWRTTLFFSFAFAWDLRTILTSLTKKQSISQRKQTQRSSRLL